MNTESMVRKVLAEHWSGEFPVCPYNIAWSMGLEIRDSIKSGFPPEICGAMSIDDCGKKIIFVSSLENECRQNFTVAHEIGHFVMNHGKYMMDRPGNFYTGVLDVKEILANEFAMNILMPEEHVYADVSKGMVDVVSLARKYNVARVAMELRLKNLGIMSDLLAAK